MDRREADGPGSFRLRLEIMVLAGLLFPALAHARLTPRSRWTASCPKGSRPSRTRRTVRPGSTRGRSRARKNSMESKTKGPRIF